MKVCLCIASSFRYHLSVFSASDKGKVFLKLLLFDDQLHYGVTISHSSEMKDPLQLLGILKVDRRT